MYRILVMEDDPDIQELLQAFLENAGYTVDLAGDGLEGVAMFGAAAYDLVLMDIMMPKIDGFAACELIRRESDVPIVMLTALESEQDQMKGFDLAIDDYVTKPFSMPILMRKVEAVLRRAKATAPVSRMTYRELVLDTEAYKATVNGAPVELTQREFELLRELLTHRGKVLTRQVLLDRLWKYDFLGDERVVDTHIKNVRKKLGVDYIDTIRGVGYRID